MNALNDIWNEVLNILSTQLTPTAINTWFNDCEPVELEDSCMVIRAKSDVKRKIISQRFRDNIKAALYELFSADFELVILANDEVYESTKERDNDLPEMAGYTFDRFIVGNSNQVAHAAAMAVAENPGKKYNPLFIYGNSGLGKTHLLFSIGQYIHEREPQKKIVYIKGDEFVNEMVRAIREGTAEEFRLKYRQADLFLVDDIQFIAGKQQTQNEFFHTFNNIHEAGHQIVITSDRPPIDMSLLDDRLRSRFEWGLMVDIAPPDFETRIAITRNKAAQLGLMLSDEAVEYIASNITSNIRQLEGVVNRLTAYREILGQVITIDYVKRSIKDIVRTGELIPTPELIIQQTARYFSIKEDEIRGQSRSKNTALARHISMYLIKTLTNKTLVEIGAEYGNRNHSTVLSSIHRVEDMLKSDAKTAATIRDITSNINSSEL